VDFGAPEWLYAFIAYPAAIVLYAVGRRLRRRSARRLGEPALIASMSASASASARAWKAALLLIATALILFSLARPRFGGHTEMGRKRGIDIAVALDFSKSMLTRDAGKTDRLSRAKMEIYKLLSELRGDRVGIIAFAGETDEFPLTTDYDAIRLFLRDLTPDDMPVGGTAIGKAIAAATELLTSPDKRRVDGGGRDTAKPLPKREAKKKPAKVMILITDGEDTTSDPIAAAKKAAEAGIRIFAVGIGTVSGGPIPVYDRGRHMGYVYAEEGGKTKPKTSHLDETTLRKIAELTRGKYFRSELETVGVERVREEIKSLQKAEFETRIKRRYEERFKWFLFPAFALLLVEVVVPDRRRKRRRKGAP
jgi:Ca-activated chloride channel family protein